MQKHISLDETLDDIAGIIANLPVTEQSSLILVLTMILGRVTEIQKETEETIARLSRTSNDWQSKSECAQ